MQVSILCCYPGQVVAGSVGLHCRCACASSELRQIVCHCMCMHAAHTSLASRNTSFESRSTGAATLEAQQSAGPPHRARDRDAAELSERGHGARRSGRRSQSPQGTVRQAASGAGQRAGALISCCSSLAKRCMPVFILFSYKDRGNASATLTREQHTSRLRAGGGLL